MSGKGDTRRPTNEDQYRKEYERIFSQPSGTKNNGKTPSSNKSRQK